jgi:DNA replicative helicase MCM subunit Mcm2 (Cdc46/Mcm family)
MPHLTPPKWTPKEQATPLKEEYLQVCQEVTWYHNCVEGNLEVFSALTKQLLDIPEPLKTFTDKILIVVSVTKLITHLSDVRALYDTTHWKCKDCTHSVSTTTGSATLEHSRSLKTTLPTSFNGSTAKALTFLAECNNYITLNQSCFPSDSIKIQWDLQLCTD